jgi:8-oxo-dGTP pyrophosphatase MutT (NUDIX family)
VVFAAQPRVLRARLAYANDWTTPGGMIEPYETPSDAAVRETWEETGLHVALTRIVGVFGGELCASRYANGDRIAWVATVFAGERIGGTPKPDGDETLEVRYVARSDVAALPCKPHVPMFLDAGYAAGADAKFQAPTWKPPAD